jgi:hypothetical protein
LPAPLTYGRFKNGAVCAKLLTKGKPSTHGARVWTMTKPGWTLDDIAWERFDPSKVDQDLLMAVKAASVVEYNARDYVGYLKAVFPDFRTMGP